MIARYERPTFSLFSQLLHCYLNASISPILTQWILLAADSLAVVGLKQHPQLVRVRPVVSLAGALILTSPGTGVRRVIALSLSLHSSHCPVVCQSVSVPGDSFTETASIGVCGDAGRVRLCRDAAVCRWLRSVVGFDCLLARCETLSFASVLFVRRLTSSLSGN